MTEIEYAINNLQDFLAADIGQGDLHMSTAETALFALREQAEREKGCEYCSGGVDERLALIDSDDGYAHAYIDGNGKLTLSDVNDVQINYCPMCGKRLEVKHI